MVRIGIKEARARLRHLLDRVSSGEQVVLLSRGKEIARLVPPHARKGRLPPMARFRGSLRIKGRPLSAMVIRMRREDRF